MKKLQINRVVTVRALGFRKNLEAYPREMEFDGVTYNFVDAGIRCMVRRGGKIAEIFTLSDGKTNYYLRTYNRGSNWTLLNIS